ncbi:putative Mitotic-spindle organizing protein 1 [Seiridium unicorne]|uniref:Mitotic-spindle organizing protein 1 n=1 Tax=Seiridium unicorne TaxID=138068 RepID=A0ABR2UTM7_9PEZI
MPPPPSKDDGEKQQAAQQAVDILHEISTILVRLPARLSGPRNPRMHMAGHANKQPQNCQLDRRTLSICISMIENGVNPEALAVSLTFFHTNDCVASADGDGVVASGPLSTEGVPEGEIQGKGSGTGGMTSRV